MIGRKRIYFDNTATTRTRREVAAEMSKYFQKIYANPSSIHEDGLIARGSIEMARERIAQVLGCDSNELVFTGSGSESNNLAIWGAATALRDKGKHIITSKIEHSSVLNTCKALEKKGFEVTYLDVDRAGRFDLARLASSLRPDTILVSLIYVNNEIGTVQDIEKIVELVKSKDILLHLDAVQAWPYFKIDLSRLDADLVSFSGHKLYAPKGIGILYIKSGTPLRPIIYGGEQEFGLRSGTENVPYIIGLSRAAILNDQEKEKYTNKLVALRDRLIKKVLTDVPDCMLTGDHDNRSPNHVSFCFKDINGKMLVKELSLMGFDVSSGSACSSPKNEPSHVLTACGIPPDYLYGSLRVTLGRYNTKGQVDYFLHVLPRVIEKMRTAKTPYQNEAIFISQKEFKKILAADEQLQIVDVRFIKYPPRDIPSSIAIPYYRLRSAYRKLDPKKETIVICYQGDILSPQAHQLLVEKGFANVKVLKGGLFNYYGFNP